MLRLPEDMIKAWLAEQGSPVPGGAAAESPSEAAAVAAGFNGASIVKALVLAGRRGKAGAVLRAATPDAARDAAKALLGREVAGWPVRRVYVEEEVAIARELFLSFTVDDGGPGVLASCAGGIEIEETSRRRPGAVAQAVVHPCRSMKVWDALDLWLDAGLRGASLRPVAALTAALVEAARAADLLLLEINPLALDAEGRPMLVGAMAAADAAALGRQPRWQGAARQVEDLPSNPRERHVAEVDRAIPGGECRYQELDGDIGLLVGGGGAGLYQHDLVLEMGGRPANHCVTPPTGSDARKLKAVIGAILDNPRVRALLVGFNFAQMARADVRVRSLVEVLDERGIDTARLPVVIRMFGAGEDEARGLVAERPGIHYLPRGASLRDAVRLVVDLAAGARTVPVGSI